MQIGSICPLLGGTFQRFVRLIAATVDIISKISISSVPIIADLTFNAFDIHIPALILYKIFFLSQGWFMFLHDLIVDRIFRRQPCDEIDPAGVEFLYVVIRIISGIHDNEVSSHITEEQFVQCARDSRKIHDIPSIAPEQLRISRTALHKRCHSDFAADPAIVVADGCKRKMYVVR